MFEVGDEIHASLALDQEPTQNDFWSRLRADLMEPQLGGWYKRHIARGGFVESYVWLSFETICKMDYFYAPDGHWDSSDTAWL
jgi:hypothetical protein